MTEVSDTEFEQQANAWADGELADAERVEFEKLLQRDAIRRARAEQIRLLKRGVRAAYKVPGRAARMESQASRAAVLTIAVLAGLVAGVLLGRFLPPVEATPVAEQLALSAQTDRVLIHIGSSDPERMQEALVSAQTVLDHYHSRDHVVRVQVLANGPGLRLLTADSQFKDQIHSLDSQYGNVQFVACQNTIDRMRKKIKREIQLLPEVLRVDSGVADITRKRRNGWMYIGA